MRLAATIISVFLFILIFSGGILYTFNQTRVYQASGTLEVIDPKPVPALQLEDLRGEFDAAAAEQPPMTEPAKDARAESDLQTHLVTLRSQTLVNGVERRLQSDQRERFMAPYRHDSLLSGPLTPYEILSANREIERIDQSRVFRVSYTHPDPMIAARVANLFMEEFIDR